MRAPDRLSPLSEERTVSRNSPRPRALAGSFLAVLIVGLIAVGCSDPTIDPFSNDGRYFTIYGYLDELETQHELRVTPITRQTSIIPSVDDPRAEIDAVVISEEYFGGQLLSTSRWTHELRQLEDETFAHIFTANFRVSAGNTYVVRVQRSDGIETSASTTVPRLDTANILEVRPLQFNADSTIIRQEIVAPPSISLPWNIRAIYLYSGGVVNARKFISYGRVGSATDEGGWAFELDPVADRPAVMAAIEDARQIGQVEPGEPVFLTAMGVDISVLDSQWRPPGGEFDPEVLAQPGTLSNVENGYGYFGSLGYYRQEWNTDAVSSALGYD